MLLPIVRITGMLVIQTNDIDGVAQAVPLRCQPHIETGGIRACGILPTAEIGEALSQINDLSANYRVYHHEYSNRAAGAGGAL